MTPTREDILALETWKAIKKGHARFLRNAVKRIRSGCCQGYEECCRDLARSNGLRIPLERALLIYDILISSSLFCFPALPTIFRNLIQLFASVLHNTLCSLIWIRSGITTLARLLNSLRKIKPTCFNLSSSVIQICSRLYQNLRHRLRHYTTSKSKWFLWSELCLNSPAVW